MHLQLNYKWQMKNPLDIQWKSTENPVKVKILHSLSRLQKGHQVAAMIRSLPIIWLLQSSGERYPGFLIEWIFYWIESSQIKNFE